LRPARVPENRTRDYSASVQSKGLDGIGGEENEMKNNKSIVIQWGSNVAGRENIGLELFLGVSNYYEGLVKDDKLGNFQTVLFENGNFQDLAGMMILTGDEDQIKAIAESDKHRENVTKAMHIVKNVNALMGTTGEAVGPRVQDLVKWRKELGL
jgi:hypothetical protein